MATKVDQGSSIEPHRTQTTVTATSSAASTSSPKVSMFGKKSGFVIPKNKLSGSLVPIIRGAAKTEGRDTAKEEGNKQVQRKTKWGTDLTQDAAVRKGRALAYQTRVEQITQQLKAGVFEKGDGKCSESLAEVPDPESSRPQKDDQLQKFEMLELEKREVIGEILKLNPSYKVPPDYKPLLKEAKIPIPLTRYPGYNFIGILLGSGSNTQKRLEEETGAKIRIHGTKVGTGEKGEITSSDGNEVQGAYEELYVHVSADTFEKVDAAVALIELLVTPVSGNSALASTTSAAVSGDSVNVFDQNQKDTANATSYMMPIGAPLNQGMVQPMMGLSQHGSLQIQFQPYRGPWFPPGPPQTATHPSSGFALSPNSSGPMPNNAIQFPPTPSNPSNMRPFFSGQPQPPTSTGFSMAPRNPSPFAPRPQQLMQGLQRPYMPEVRPPNQGYPSMNYPMPNQQNPHGYPSMPPQPNTGMPHSQPIPTGPAPVGGQMMYSTPQPVPTTAVRSLPGRQLTPVGSSTGWSLGMTNMARPMVPPRSLHSVGPQPATGNMVSPTGFSFQPSNQLPSAPVHHPAAGVTFTPRPPHVGPVPVSASVPPFALPSHMPSSASAPSSVAEPTSAPLSLGSSQTQSGTPISVAGSLPGFTPIKPPLTSLGSIPPPVTTPMPQRPNSGDFTFQPLRPQLPASQTSPGPSHQSVAQNALHFPPNPTPQPPPPQAPSFRPAVHNSTLQVGMQGYLNPRATNQVGQPQAPIPALSPSSVIPFAANLSPIETPPRLLSFPNPNPILLTSPVSQQARQMSNSPGSLPSRPVNPPQLQQNHQLAPTTRPGNLLVPNQQFSVNQVYDPLSPTSIPPSVSQQGDDSAKKRENDMEYEDLMAKVGVR